MAFFTELFSRPRPQDACGIRAVSIAAIAWDEPRRPTREPRPADFPRLPRRFSVG